jgi:hypothetical protein
MVLNHASPPTIYEFIPSVRSSKTSAVGQITCLSSHHLQSVTANEGSQPLAQLGIPDMLSARRIQSYNVKGINRQKLVVYIKASTS